VFPRILTGLLLDEPIIAFGASRNGWLVLQLPFYGISDLSPPAAPCAIT
jgi:hypothetical protein